MGYGVTFVILSLGLSALAADDRHEYPVADKKIKPTIPVVEYGNFEGCWDVKFGLSYSSDLTGRKSERAFFDPNDVLGKHAKRIEEGKDWAEVARDLSEAKVKGKLKLQKDFGYADYFKKAMLSQHEAWYEDIVNICRALTKDNLEFEIRKGKYIELYARHRPCKHRKPEGQNSDWFKIEFTKPGLLNYDTDFTSDPVGALRARLAKVLPQSELVAGIQVFADKQKSGDVFRYLPREVGYRRRHPDRNDEKWPLGDERCETPTPDEMTAFETFTARNERRSGDNCYDKYFPEFLESWNALTNKVAELCRVIPADISNGKVGEIYEPLIKTIKDRMTSLGNHCPNKANDVFKNLGAEYLRPEIEGFLVQSGCGAMGTPNVAGFTPTNIRKAMTSLAQSVCKWRGLEASESCDDLRQGSKEFIETMSDHNRCYARFEPMTTIKTPHDIPKMIGDFVAANKQKAQDCRFDKEAGDFEKLAHLQERVFTRIKATRGDTRKEQLDSFCYQTYSDKSLDGLCARKHEKVLWECNLCCDQTRVGGTPWESSGCYSACQVKNEEWVAHEKTESQSNELKNDYVASLWFGDNGRALADKLLASKSLYTVVNRMLQLRDHKKNDVARMQELAESLFRNLDAVGGTEMLTQFRTDRIADFDKSKDGVKILILEKAREKALVAAQHRERTLAREKQLADEDEAAAKLAKAAEEARAAKAATELARRANAEQAKNDLTAGLAAATAKRDREEKALREEETRKAQTDTLLASVAHVSTDSVKTAAFIVDKTRDVAKWAGTTLISARGKIADVAASTAAAHAQLTATLTTKRQELERLGQSDTDICACEQKENRCTLVNPRNPSQGIGFYVSGGSCTSTCDYFRANSYKKMCEGKGVAPADKVKVSNLQAEIAGLEQKLAAKVEVPTARPTPGRARLTVRVPTNAGSIEMDGIDMGDFAQSSVRDFETPEYPTGTSVGYDLVVKTATSTAKFKAWLKIGKNYELVVATNGTYELKEKQ